MDDAIRLEFAEDILDKAVVAKVARPEPERSLVPFAKRRKALLHCADGRRAPGTHLVYPASAKRIVRASHHVPAPDQVLRQGPSQISIHTRDEDSHSSHSPFCSGNL